MAVFSILQFLSAYMIVTRANAEEALNRLNTQLTDHASTYYYLADACKNPSMWISESGKHVILEKISALQNHLDVWNNDIIEVTQSIERLTVNAPDSPLLITIRTIDAFGKELQDFVDILDSDIAKQIIYLRERDYTIWQGLWSEISYCNIL